MKLKKIEIIGKRNSKICELEVELEGFGFYRLCEVFRVNFCIWGFVLGIGFFFFLFRV